jgi:hypothetical protein
MQREQRQVIKQREKLERSSSSVAAPPPPPYSAGDGAQVEEQSEGGSGNDVVRRVVGATTLCSSLALGAVALNPAVSVPLGIAWGTLSVLGILEGSKAAFS